MITDHQLQGKLPDPSYGAPCRPHSHPLLMDAVNCCICDVDDAEPIAVGEDFEYRTSPDTFLAMRCRGCGLVYLNPRPAMAELDVIYPADYHAYEFSAERYGLIYRVRRKLEAKRLLESCRGLGPNARIIDIGCGDGFHLQLLRDFGQPSWQLSGVEPSDLAVRAGTRAGLTIHQGIVQELNLPEQSYDLAFMIATIEHVDHPAEVLAAVRSLLKPGGRVVIVTDNTDTLDFKLFRERHWGGYHFPRHWNLFNPHNMRLLAAKVDLPVASLATIVSPVNWVYSIRNWLVDWRAPKWLINCFSLQSTGALVIFTLFDTLHQWLGHGALMKATLRRPE
jgi:SAM-dependent methyltransferase